MTVYECPVCGRTADYVGFAAEEILTANTGDASPIEISTLKCVIRNILVRCSEHGEKIVQIFGHHIDTPGEFQDRTVGGGVRKKRRRR